MQAVLINTEEAPNKWWAAQDARMRNETNKTHYPLETQLQVSRMLSVMDMLYSAQGIYDAYGKKGVSIKINKAVIRDRKNLRALEADWAKAGVTKKMSAQGVIYRIAI